MINAGTKILKGNLINLLGMTIVYIIASTIVAINIANNFEKVLIIAGKYIITTPVIFLYLSIFWIPCYLIIWACDYIFLIELECNKYIAMAFECLLLGIPIIWLWLDNYSTKSIDLNLPYPLLMVSLTITQYYKMKYFSKIGLLQ